jgi:hypothetical protein
MLNRSSWSILDFAKEEGEAEYVLPQPSAAEPPRKLTAAERFALIRNRPDRKGRGARRRAGEKKWQTKGK